MEPSTGASSKASSASSEARRAVESGPTVDIWITVVPSPRPAATPSGPSVTSASACGSATIVITASTRPATSAGLSATWAPATASGSAFERSRFQTTRS